MQTGCIKTRFSTVSDSVSAKLGARAPLPGRGRNVWTGSHSAQGTFADSLTPYITVGKLLCAFPFRKEGAALVFSWRNWEFVSGILVYGTMLVLCNVCGEVLEFQRLRTRGQTARSALFLLGGAVWDRHLPNVMQAVERFDVSVQRKCRISELRRADRLSGRGFAVAAALSALFVSSTDVLVNPWGPDLGAWVATWADSTSLAHRQVLLLTYLLFTLAVARRFHLLRSCATSSNLLCAEELRLLHARLQEAVDSLQTCFGPRIALYFACVMLEMLLDIYILFYMGPYGSTANFLFNAFNLTFILAICFCSEHLSQSVLMFMMQVTASPVHVSAAGFCVVNRGTLVSILVAMTTYFIAMVQSAEDLKRYTDVYLNQTAG